MVSIGQSTLRGVSFSPTTGRRLSSGSSGGGGTPTPSRTTTKKIGFETGIFKDGKLIGIEDSLKGESRLPTSTDIIKFGSRSAGVSAPSVSTPTSPTPSRTQLQRPRRIPKSILSSPTQIKQKFLRGTKQLFQDIPLKTIGLLQKRREELRKRKEEIIKEQGVKSIVSKEVKKIDKELQRLAIATAGVEAVLIPAGLLALIRKPSSIKEIPSNLKKEAIKTGKIALISPNEAIAIIGGELLLLKGTGKTFTITGKFTGKTASRLTGKLAKIDKTKIIIPKGQLGKETINIKIAKPGLKKISTPLKEQVKQAGKTRPIVTSAQADRLVTLIKTKRVIRKPIPNENLLKTSTKRLLKKFDDKNISRKELLLLERKIRIETKGAGSILERSFFVDPKGRVRLSRLGIQKEAGLLDIIKGNFTLRTQKPQILFFKDIQVQAFPKTPIFAQIKKKLNANKQLTKQEADALLKFQLKKSGKFKPIGALSKEPELTLAPGEIIKKVKVVARVEINGKLVPIVQAKVIKSTKKTKTLLNKANAGKLTKKELKQLEKRLKKETGFKASQISRRTKTKPRLSPRRKLGVGLTRVTKIKRKPVRPTKRKPKRPKKRKPKRPPSKMPKRPPKRPPTRPPTRPPKRPPKRPPARPPTRPPTRPPIKKPPIIPKGSLRKIRKKKKPTRQKGYNVFARPLKRTKKQKRPKLIKVNKVPLTKKGAKDLRNYVVDTSLSRTGTIKPTRGKVGKSKFNAPVGYQARTRNKFRTFRKVKGKRKALPKGKVIERKKRLLDTRQEKKQITLRRRIKQIQKPIKKKKKMKGGKK